MSVSEKPVEYSFMLKQLLVLSEAIAQQTRRGRPHEGHPAGFRRNMLFSIVGPAREGGNLWSDCGRPESAWDSGPLWRALVCGQRLELVAQSPGALTRPYASNCGLAPTTTYFERKTMEIKIAGVVGAGLMGSGIAIQVATKSRPAERFQS